MSRGTLPQRRRWAMPIGAVGLAAFLGGCASHAADTTSPPATGGADTTAVTTTQAAAARTPVVLDTDLALDSVMAVLYLLGHPGLDVQALTVSGTGEVHCEPGVGIAVGLAALAESADIPVACGPEEPLEGFNAFPTAWRVAADDAWGLELPAGSAPSDLPAPELLVSVISSSAVPVVVFTDGPLTNLAAALRLDPGIVDGIEMVYAMGGAIDVPGNTPQNPDAEYNIWVDPTAAAEVFASGVPLTLIPLDATNQVPLSRLHLRVLQEHPGAPGAEAAVTMLEANAGFLMSGQSFFWDQLAAALLVDESLAGFETMRLAVVTEGERDAAGRTVRTADGAEVRVAVTVDVARFEREFLSALAGEDVGPVAAPAKRPAATIEELVAAVYAAAGTGDADAWEALCADDARQVVYLVTEETGRFGDDYAMADWDPAADPLEGMEVLGEPLVSGQAAAIPIRYTYGAGSAGVTGFGLIVADRVEGGLLVAGGASFFAPSGTTEADPLVVEALADAEVAAWNAGDIDGLLAIMTDDVDYGGLTGTALREALAQSFWFTMERTGPPVVSGPFAVVPHRLTDEASGAVADGISVYWIRDGKIAMRTQAQGD